MKTLKNTFILLAAFAATLAGAQTAAQAAEATEEQAIALLQSNASLQLKDAACARLKRIGTAASIPVLAGLLADENLSHSARYALESMSAPEAGQALVQALTKTAGLTRVGVISSVGNRREAGAIPELGKIAERHRYGDEFGRGVRFGQDRQ